MNSKKILLYYIVGNNKKIENYLKKTNQVSSIDLENLTNNKQYDYIIVDTQKVQKKDIEKLTENLSSEGTIILIMDNPYGITRFVTYNYEEQISPLEQEQEYPNIEELCHALMKKNFFIKKYMVYPDKEKVDMLIREDLEDILDKTGKYFYHYKEGQVVLCNEANLMQNILKYDKDLYKKLANSYFIEATLQENKNDIKYVSFNNYRKDAYRLITKIREEIVSKEAENEQAQGHIQKISENIKLLENYPFKILDKNENNKVYSILIKNKETLDVELANHAKNVDYIIYILQNIKEKLLKYSITYQQIEKKEQIFLRQDYTEEELEKFHFLENAFYDMVPKNCFYINEEFYFFDQEWMEKYLTVEFILYRSIINSYDLVKKININEVLEKLDLLEDRELFEKIDAELRENIIDKERLKICNKEYKKMYEIIYENKILHQDNRNKEALIEEYKQNNHKQDAYIKSLEQQNLALKEENAMLNEKNKKRTLFGKA